MAGTGAARDPSPGGSGLVTSRRAPGPDLHQRPGDMMITIRK